MKLTYCPECAAELTKLDATHYVCPTGHHYYNNPRASAVAIIIKDNKVLVSKRAIEPNKGKYDLPGGFIEYGEKATDAVAREIKEETGMEVHRSRLIACHTLEYIENVSVVDILMHVQEWSGEPVAADDSEALEWQPFSFVNSDIFGSDYPGLEKLLEDIAADKL
jgi:mutator protein MutT